MAQNTCRIRLWAQKLLKDMGPSSLGSGHARPALTVWAHIPGSVSTPNKVFINGPYLCVFLGGAGKVGARTNVTSFRLHEPPCVIRYIGIIIMVLGGHLVFGYLDP